MNDDKLKDDELIKLLREFPSIQDEKTMEEVYDGITNKLKNTRQGSKKKESKKKRFIWPTLATAAVFVLSFFLISNQVSNNQKNDRAAEQTKMAVEFSTEEADGLEKSVPFNSAAEDKAIEIPNSSIDIVGLSEHNYAVYQEDIQSDEFVVTIGVPDKNVMNMVPISVIVEKEPGKTWVDFYNFVYENIDEEKLGLSDYYPYQGNLKLSDNKVTLDLLANHQYAYGTSSEGIFFSSLNYLKYQNVDTIFLEEESKPGVEFSHTGLIYEHIINDENSGYLLFPTEEYLFFTPSPNGFDSIEEALIDMKKENKTYNLQPTIPNQLTFSLEDEGTGKLNIMFQDGTELVDDDEAIRMIEAVLLTAKEYGYESVQFENAPIDKIGRFNLSEPLQVPIAPNPVEIDNN